MTLDQRECSDKSDVTGPHDPSDSPISVDTEEGRGGGEERQDEGLGRFMEDGNKGAGIEHTHTRKARGEVERPATEPTDGTGLF